MSIATEVSRLQDAKAAIKAAIEGKGVTVPDGTLLDGMAAMIAAIEAGAGAKIATGTVVPADGQGITIEHGLGEVPNVFFWCTTDFVNHTTTDRDGGVIVASRGNGDTFCGGYIDGQSFFVRTTASSANSYYYYLFSNNLDKYSRKIYSLTSDKIRSPYGILAYGAAGETVRWVAMVV